MDAMGAGNLVPPVTRWHSTPSRTFGRSHAWPTTKAVMAEITVQSSSGRSSVEIGIDRVWRFFCSVRAAVAEIALLAILVLIGTLRGSDVPQWIANVIPATQPLVDRWYAWDVYRSPIFAILLAVISIAIAVCTINRVPGIWQTISHPVIRTSPGYLARAETSATFQTNLDAATLQGELKTALGKKRYRVLSESIGSDTHLYADKNRFAKLATFPFHLALILLLVGGSLPPITAFAIGNSWSPREPRGRWDTAPGSACSSTGSRIPIRRSGSRNSSRAT